MNPRSLEAEGSEAGTSSTEEALPYIRRLLKDPAVTQGS